MKTLKTLSSEVCVKFATVYDGVVTLDQAKATLEATAKELKAVIKTAADYAYALDTLKERIGYDKLSVADKAKASNRFRYMRVTLFPWIPAKRKGAAVNSHNKGKGKVAKLTPKGADVELPAENENPSDAELERIEAIGNVRETVESGKPVTKQSERFALMDGLQIVLGCKTPKDLQEFVAVWVKSKSK